MESRLIECKFIDVPKTDGSKRTFSKDFAIKLADSVRIDGQLTPAVVRPNPAVPGRFLMVAGRHRFYAIKNVLKEQFIYCTVMENMDQAEADIAADVENLWRNPLSKPQAAGAMKRWHAKWISLLPAPEADKAVAAPVAAPASNDHDDQSPAPATAVAEASTTPKNEAEFNKSVAAITGQSEVSVRRLKALANAFTEDQLEVFTQMETNQKDMLTISKIKDVAKRGEVVNLLVTGLTTDEAIDEVMKDEAPSKYNGPGKEVEASKKAAKAEKAPELTDEEWLAANCGEKAALFGDPAKYKDDALLFRELSNLRHEFRVKAKKIIAESRKRSVGRSFLNLVNRFISISHPKDWFICGECRGQGTKIATDGDGELIGGPEKCPKCYGSCYLLKTEEYL